MPTKLAYYSFRYLHGSIEALRREVDFANASLSQKLSLYIFTAFTYESFLNHVGHYVCSTWDEHLKPKLSPTGKMAFLCEVGKIDLDKGKSPFQTFYKVMELRNQLAHAETEFLTYDKSKHPNPEDWPRPKWQITVENLIPERVVNDLDEVIKLLEDSLNIERIPPFLLMEAVGGADESI